MCHFITTFATFCTVNCKIGERSAFFPRLQFWRYCSREGKGYEEELQRRWNFAGRSCSCCRLLPFSTIDSLNVGVLITNLNFNFQFYFKISYISGQVAVSRRVSHTSIEKIIIIVINYKKIKAKRKEAWKEHDDK